MDEIKLKPCPFCGGEAVLRIASEIWYNGRVEIGGWKAACKKCGIETAIENRETAAEKWNRRKSCWIPCSERMPGKDKSYITYSETTKYGTHNEVPEELRINVLYFDGEDWYDEECTYYNVTHYMPLPGPPEKE